MQLGAIAVVLAASLHRAFELDRFLVPKELVLHVTAVVAGLCALRLVRALALTWIDVLLFAWLVLGALSAALAQNRWVGVRALAVSASAAVVFWVARSLREAGLARPLLHAIAFAIVLAAVTSLLQAYGLRLDLFALDRAPGGTLGNRNFIGHAMAFGLPVLLFAAMQSARWIPGVPFVAAALVLTRSRAAWIACAASLLVFLVVLVMRGDGRAWRRVAAIALLAGGGVAAALLVPNALRWRSDNPYLDSMASVARYDEGSGHGRLVQYERSLRMAARYPLFGVGPGNWPVAYPAHAALHDPSLNESEPGMTFNPWPSSDWVAFIAERGFAATLLLLLVFAGLALSRGEDWLARATLLATIAAAGVAGAFDAVLLLGAPSLLVWSAIGALYGPAASERRGVAMFAIFAIALSAIGAVRSASQLAAMEMYVSNTSLRLAARIDPANYRLRLRLARGGNRKERCGHARAAHELFPNTEAARALARGCGKNK